MRKAIAIIVLGLLWCNVGFAEIIKLSCNPKAFGNADHNVIYEYSYLTIDSVNKTFHIKDKGYVKKKGQQDFAFNSTFSIITMNEESITFENNGMVFKFNYGSDYKEIKIKPIYDPNNGWNYNCTNISIAEKPKNKTIEKPKFASKEKQYEHTCGKALGLRKGSKRFMECALKIMETELELTKLQAEKEVALARVEAAMANQQMEKVTELNAIANAKSQKFKKNVGNLLLGLLVLGEINSASQQANSFKKVFTCSSTGFATGTQYAVNCY